METVAVIGSNSFSGSDFVDLLLTDTDYRVVGISRSPEKDSLFLPYRKRHDLARFTFKQCDLNRDMTALQNMLGEIKPSYIVNFAAQSEVGPSWKHPEHWFQTNAVAIAALGNWMKDQKWLKRYVHISSPEVYGTCTGVVKENHPMDPSTPYAASKAAGDFMLFTLVKNFDFPMVMIRGTNVYGAHQQLFKIIPRSAIYLKQGKQIELHGGGVAVKSYIHIRDISRGELMAMEKGRSGQMYHLSTPQGVAVKDVVSTICKLMKKDFATSTKVGPERLGQDKAYVIDSTKAFQEFGWRPQITLEQGLQGVIGWIDEEWDHVQKETLDYVHKQ
jgi:dTDP-glucose 4,6-dehydratase